MEDGWSSSQAAATGNSWNSPGTSDGQPVGPAGSSSVTSTATQGVSNIQSVNSANAGPSATTYNGYSGGDPGAGGAAVGQNRTANAKVGPYLRVRITGLERNRKDMLVRFDASTNLPQFRATIYRNMQRSYVEFQMFAESVAIGNPHTIIPALPLPQTSAATDDEDDRLVRIALQRWLTRVCEDPALQRDEDVRNFIESDFGYQAQPRPPGHMRSASSSSRFASISKVFRKGGPPDEDEDLQAAKSELQRLEEKWAAVSKCVIGTGKARKALADAQVETAAKMANLATVEIHPDLSFAFRRVGKTWENLAGLLQAEAISDNIVLSDSFGYQSMNAKAARETLDYRTQVLSEAQNASKTAINKRRTVERLKTSNSINSQKVDEALEELRDAQETDTLLSRKVQAISAHLRSALRNHSRQVHEDAATILLEHAKSRIAYEKQALKDLNALRPDIQNIGKGVSGRRTTAGFGGPTAASRAIPVLRTAGGPSAVMPVGGVSSTPTQIPPQAMPQAPYLPDGSGFRYPEQAQQASIPPMMAQSMYVPSPRGHSAPQFYQQASIPPQGYVNTGAGPAAMAQSMFMPAPAAQSLANPPQGVFGGRRKLDDRDAARSLASMF